MNNKQANSALEKAKQSHFDYLRKNNSITDAKNGDLSLGAMKTLDIILQAYQETQEVNLTLEIATLRKKLGLQNNNAYIERIKLYLSELKLPFELRDFTELNSGKKVDWAITSFLNDVKAYKESQHFVDVEISQNFIHYMVDKAGYTNIDLKISSDFKTKFGYKIYEMYLRYYSLKIKNMPVEKGLITKSINELNEKFGTTYTQPSKLMIGIKRGLKEIKKITQQEIKCEYSKIDKKFIFTWQKSTKPLLKNNTNCPIPLSRVEELAEWIIEHSEQNIDSYEAYKQKLCTLIKNNKYIDWESSYRGLMTIKYHFTSEDVDKYKDVDGKYKDFNSTKSLF